MQQCNADASSMRTCTNQSRAIAFQALPEAIVALSISSYILPTDTWLASCPCSDAMAYLVLLEAVLLLLVCASTQLYTQQTAAPLGSHPLLEGLMGQQQSAAALVTALLQLVVVRAPQTAQLQLYTPPAEGSTGVMRLVRTAAGALALGRTEVASC